MANKFDNTKLLYVQGYRKSPESKAFDSAYGIDEQGAKVEFTLRPMDEIHKRHEMNPHAVIPDFDRIALGNAKKAGCQASVDNSPENPAGLILFDQVERSTTDSSGVTHYVAQWPRILRHGPNDQDPLLAVPGYVERAPYFTTNQGVPATKARFLQSELARQMVLLRQYAASGDSDAYKLQAEHIRKLQIQFDELVSIRYRAVVIDADGESVNSLTYKISTLDKLERKLISIINDNSIEGAHGGVMIRAMDSQGQILLSASGGIHTRYDPLLRTDTSSTGAVTDPASEVSRYLASPRGSALFNLHRENATLELIPTRRYNFGPASNKKYARTIESDRMFQLFKNPADHTTVARHIAVRTSAPKSDINTRLVSEVFSTGNEIGSPLQVGPKGTTLPFSHENQAVPKVGRPTMNVGRRYIVETDESIRAVVECKQGEKGVGLYTDANVRLENYKMIGPAPSTGPTL